MKRVAIVQSNYIPWKGYFDMIASVDEFIIYDDMQYTRRDWRNRNKIKTPQGLQWLTVPVKVSGKFEQKIRETEIEGTKWQKEHWNALVHNYGRAPFFTELAAQLEPLYFSLDCALLSDLNRKMIEWVCGYLAIRTRLSNSWDYALGEGKSERLADLVAQAGGSVYVSGPAAKDYLDEQVFTSRDIQVEWMDYTGYREYPQLWGAFEHGVTVLDLLFNCGPESREYMKFSSR
jgi:hypothetical protein